MPYNHSALSFNLENNGIAKLTFDLPNEKVNKLSSPVLFELDEILNEIVNNKKIKILQILSGKKDNFIAGADINEIKDLIDEKEALQKVAQGQEILTKIAKLPFPTIAVVNGSCLGGGLELALACQYRVGVIAKKTILGLPEVNLGIIPGFGGTQRLPELVGLEESLKIILSGKSIDISKAFKIGLLDIAIHSEFLEAKLDEFTEEILKNPLKNSYLNTRNQAMKKRFIQEILFLKKYLIFSYTKKQLWEKTKGHYLAPFYALEVVKRTYRSTYGNRGFRTEREAFSELVISEISKNLITIFFTNEAL